MGVGSGVDSAVVTAVISAAARSTGMEVAFIGALSSETFTFRRLCGEWAGLAEGSTLPRADSFCARMLDGAPPTTADASSVASYAELPLVREFGVRSYVGVPICTDGGDFLGTLCAIDHHPVPVAEQTLTVLQALAQVIAAQLESAPGDVVIRRTREGWRVDGADVDPELGDAMVLADLLSDADGRVSRPAKPPGALDEIGRLRLSVTQLEHALTARVVVEQAIGVLTERHGIAARAAFERLRRAARSRGRRVHDLAREVVASAAEAGVPLPPELSGRRR